MTRTVRRRWVAIVGALALATAACGSSDDDDSSDADTTADAATADADADDGDEPGGEQADSSDEEPADDAATESTTGDAAASDEELPTVVVTTNILGDVVGDVLGDQANVVTIVPVGADPHDFQPSAQEIDQLLSADALIVNGANFEEGLLDVIESARDDGVPTHEAMETVDAIEFGADGHDHGDEEHGDEDHGDEGHGDDDHDHGDEDHDHEHDGADPHFFTDPMRMAAAVEGITAFLTEEVDAIDAAALQTSSDAYVAELEALDADVQAMVDPIAADQRIMVTNHASFGYFADRYGFEIVGVVIPGGTTTEGVSAGELAELAGVIEAEGVPAIFADTSSSNELAETLAAEVGDIAVVELYSESLGDPDSEGATYLAMVRTNAERVTDALT